MSSDCLKFQNCHKPILMNNFHLTMSQMKKPISRTVLPSDSKSIDGGLSVSGMSGYSATLDRPYRHVGAGDYPTATVPRNYHYGPVGVYDDYRAGPPSEAYTSLSRGSHMDERYRYKIIISIINLLWWHIYLILCPQMCQIIIFFIIIHKNMTPSFACSTFIALLHTNSLFNKDHKCIFCQFFYNSNQNIIC